MDDLNGKQKAAAVLLSVDSETAAAVLKKLPEDELASVTREMHKLGDVNPENLTTVLHEFSIHASMPDESLRSNPRALRQRLELAVGRDSVRKLYKDIGLDDTAERAFESLAELGSRDLYTLIEDEHPQTAAVILSSLDPKQTAETLGHFHEERRVDVIRRMAGTQVSDDNIIKRVGEIMHSKTSTIGERRKSAPEDPRYKKVAEVLNLLGPDVEGEILDKLSEDAPEMVAKLRDMMFVFDDVVSLSDADTRKVLMSIDTQILAMALKTTSPQLREKIFSNLSRRATEMVTEELELLGPKPLSQVKAAQQQILDTIRELDASGEIHLRGATSEEDPLV